MKRFLSNSFYQIWFLILAVRVGLYRWKNFRKDKILIYTDSRGHEISGLFNKHNPFSLYAGYFIKNYCATARIVPEKHTTIYDFLYEMKYSQEKFKWVVAHIGVVCFAPRPESQFREVIALKKHKIIDLFGEDFYAKLSAFEGYPDMYNGERTFAVSPEFALPLIAEKMNLIPNLIWITCNPVLSDWRGNYSKDRPGNMNMVNSKSIVLRDLLKTAKIIDFTGFSELEVKKYTSDNIHISEAGSSLIETEIRKFIAD